MNLTSLIPDSVSLTVSFDPITGESGAGLTGVADRLASQDFGSAASALGGMLLDRVDATIPSADGLPFEAAIGTLNSLSGIVGAPPSDLTSGLQRPLGEVGAVVDRIPELVNVLTAVAEQVELARGGDLTPLIRGASESLLDVVQTATGPRLAGLQGWQAYLVDLAEEIRALIALGGTPEELRQRLLDYALDQVRAAVANLAPEIGGIRLDAEAFLGGLVPDVPALNLGDLRDTATAHLSAVLAAADVDDPDLGGLIDDYNASVRVVTDTLHNVLDDLEAAFAHPLLTPGGVNEIIGREIDRVNGIRVDDFSNVVETVEGFFVEIEEAVDAVDLSAIGDGIDAFFGTVQAAVEGLNPGGIAEELDGITAEVDGALDRVEETITGVTSQIQGWIGEVAGQAQTGLDQLGSMGPDGRFHFTFEAEVDALYGRIDALIQGDPANPAAFNIRGALEEFQATILGLIAEVESALAGLIAQLIAARDQAAGALEDVRGQIEAVDPQAVMDQANSALEGAFEQIGELDFNLVVDPVITELEKARDELSQIDVSQLDGLLREALATALEGVLSLNFEVDVTDAIMVEFDELLEIPRSVLNEIGEKINELIRRVTDISPEALLEPIQQQIDRMTATLDVDVGPALAPLEDVHGQMVARVRALDPSQFLTPLVDGFADLRGVVEGLRPEELLRPAQEGIDQLGARVAGIDLAGPLTPVNAVFGDIDRFLDLTEPESLLSPLREPFGLLNRTLEPLRPTELLAPVSDIMDQIGDFTDAITEPVTDQIRGLFDEALARADSLDPTAVLAELRAPIMALRGRIELLRPAALLHVLQQSYTPVRAGVTASDGRTGSSLTVRLEIGAPTLAFGAVMGRYERVIARIDAVLAGLDPAPLTEGFAQARARLEELLPVAIRDDITPNRLLTLIGLTDPAQWIARLDEIYDRVVGKLNLLDPAQIIAPLSDIHDALRAALAGVDVGEITDRLQQVVARIGDLVSSISLTDAIEPLLGQLDALRAMVLAIDPTPLVDALGARFQAVVSLFDEFGPEPVIEALRQAWSALSDRVLEMFDLQTIAAPLIAIFDALKALLGGLDAGVLIGTIDARLVALRDSLREALERTAQAFRAMISAAPLRGSGAGAGGSISL